MAGSAAKGPKSAKNDELTNKDFEIIINSFIDTYGLVDHQTRVYDEFLNKGIEYILKHLFTIEATDIEYTRRVSELDKTIDLVSFKVVFTNVKIIGPTHTRMRPQDSQPLSPIDAHLNDLHYMANVLVSIKATATAKNRKGDILMTREDIMDNIELTAIPIPVMSQKSMLYSMSPRLLLSQHWDPYDTGAQFIIAGREIAINLSEEVIFNSPNIFRNVGHKNELSYTRIISREGDSFEHSFQVYIRLITSGLITFEVNYLKFKLHLPFYMIMRLLGVSRDIDIVDTILMTREYTEVEKELLLLIDNAFGAPLTKDMEMYTGAINIFNPNELITFISNANMNTEVEDISSMRYFNDQTMTYVLDRVVLPHLGKTIEDRPKKARYIGFLINQTLRVYLKMLPETDRDSCLSKRYYQPGMCMTKQLKHNLKDVIKDVRRSLIKAFTNFSFNEVFMKDVIVNTIKNDHLKQSIVKALNSGKPSNPNGITNARAAAESSKVHVKTEPYNRKSAQFMIAAMRTVRTKDLPTKMNERAHRKRRVHPTMIRYFCPITSADTGEKVGNVKSMAITSRITYASSSQFLKTKILTNAGFPVPALLDIPVINLSKMSIIHVNGDPVAACSDSRTFVNYYRGLRRTGEIHRETTIYWNHLTDHVYMWVDFGRSIAPMLIVYENPDDTRTDERGIKVPRQHLKFDREVIQRMLNDEEFSFDYFLENGIMEFISDEEALNTLVAESYEDLRNNEFNPLIRYTHCEIKLAIFGMLGLATPFIQHSQTQRTTYATNQIKQTYGIPAFNWPWRMDKQNFMQHKHHIPLISTFASKHVFMGGQNLIIAITTYRQQGMEDSCIAKREMTEAGGMCGSYFDVKSTTLGSHENWGIPPTATVNESYSKIVPGEHCVRPGIYVNEGDVLISKYEVNRNATNELQRTEPRPVTWSTFEQMYIEKVIPQTYDADQNSIAKVKLRSIRKFNIGDKVSATSGNKSICAMKENATNMMFSEDGIIPDIIINPQAFPSRMISGQIKEVEAALLAAIRGSQIEATMSDEISTEQIENELKKFGFQEGGMRQFYDGLTGDPIECKIYTGINFYNRLEKNVFDEVYAATLGPSIVNPLTRQMLQGKAKDGGLRIGEMERDALISSGAVNVLNDKFANSKTNFIHYVCRTCGHYAINTLDKSICRHCSARGEVVAVPTTYVNNTIQNFIGAMHLAPSFEIAPPPIESHNI